MQTRLRIECSNCGHWNNLEVEKAMLNPDSTVPKVKVFIPSYLSLKTQKCEKCKTTLAGPNELFSIIDGEAVRYRMKDLRK